MYISQYIYIAYVYLYICIYVYAIDTCKENERKGSWYVDEAFFFFLSQQQLSHLALVFLLNTKKKKFKISRYLKEEGVCVCHSTSGRSRGNAERREQAVLREECAGHVTGSARSQPIGAAARTT